MVSKLNFNMRLLSSIGLVLVIGCATGVAAVSYEEMFSQCEQELVKLCGLSLAETKSREGRESGAQCLTVSATMTYSTCFDSIVTAT